MSTYTGPIHAGDWFIAPRQGSAGSLVRFVWAARGGGGIELRNYNTKDNKAPEITHLSETELRTWTLIEANPCGQLICPAVRP